MAEALATARLAHALPRLLARAVRLWQGWGFAKVGGGWLATLLEIALRTRPMLFYQKNFDTPTGTIRAHLNIFQRFLQR